MEGGASMPDLSGILNLLSANPSILSSISSLLQGKSTPPACETCNIEEKCPPPLPPALPKRCDSKEVALLNALKPFLSPEKCKTVDLVIKIAGILELVKNYG